MEFYDNLSTRAHAEPAHPPSEVVSVAIGALLRRRANGRAELLITQRPDGAVYAGYWELPGGKRHDGESPEQCLRREFIEELGVSIDVGQALPTIDHVYDHAHVRLHPYYCMLGADSPPPRNLEVAAHRWVTSDALADYRFPEANATLIERLRHELR